MYFSFGLSDKLKFPLVSEEVPVTKTESAVVTFIITPGMKFPVLSVNEPVTAI
jgi:hypothetical protein